MICSCKSWGSFITSIHKCNQTPEQKLRAHMKHHARGSRWERLWHDQEFQNLVLDPGTFRKKGNRAVHDSPLDNIVEAVQALPDEHRKQILLDSVEILREVAVAAQARRFEGGKV
jgi:hypothetical protein